MELRNPFHFSFTEFITDSNEIQRKKLLNLLLLAVGGGTLMGVVAVTIATFYGIAGNTQEVTLLYTGILSTLSGVIIIYLINHYFSTDMASILFLILLLFIAVFTDEPHEVVNGRGLLIFSIPIISASILVRPWVSYVMAGLSSLAIILIALPRQDLSPNVLAIIGFFLIATISWVSSRIHVTSLQYSQKTAQNLLQEKKKLQKYLDIAGVMLIVINRRGLVELINKKGCEILGYAEEEIIGKNWFDSFLPESIRGEVKQIFENLVEGKISLSEYYENPVLTSSGEERIIAWHNTIITDRQETIQGTLSSGEDITEKKQAEEKLKKYSVQLEEMVEERTSELHDAQEELVRKEKLAVLGELAGGVSHELRNPLGALKNAVYFLRMAIEDPDSEINETLDILEKEVDTSERIITSLLDFARPQNPIKVKTDLSGIIDDVLSQLPIPEDVSVEIDLHALPPILVDPQQLAQVFRNVLLNSIQAMPDGGILSISSNRHDERLSISVTDTGEGFNPDIQEKLFEPLFTSKARGIGLGLAISKTLVEGNGGTITARSTPGEGSTFTVTLPVGGELT